MYTYFLETYFRLYLINPIDEKKLITLLWAETCNKRYL